MGRCKRLAPPQHLARTVNSSRQDHRDNCRPASPQNSLTGSHLTALDCLADTMVARIHQRKEKPHPERIRSAAYRRRPPKSKAADPSVRCRTDHNSRNGFNAGERYIRTVTDARGDIVQCLAFNRLLVGCCSNPMAIQSQQAQNRIATAALESADSIQRIQRMPQLSRLATGR